MLLIDALRDGTNLFGISHSSTKRVQTTLQSLENLVVSMRAKWTKRVPSRNHFPARVGADTRLKRYEQILIGSTQGKWPSVKAT